MSMPAAALLFGRGLTISFRAPTALLLIVAAPLALFWAPVQLLGALPALLAHFPTPTYVDYVAPGACVAAPLPGAVFCGLAAHADRDSGVLEALLAAPIARVSLLVGVLLTAAVCAALSALVVLLAALAGGLPLPGGPLAALALVGVAALVGICYSALTFTLATLPSPSWSLVRSANVDNGGHSGARGAGTALAALSLLLSDLLLPSTLLPAWLTTAARINPLTYAMRVARSLVWSQSNGHDLAHTLAILGCMTLVACGAALAALYRLIGAPAL